MRRSVLDQSVERNKNMYKDVAEIQRMTVPSTTTSVAFGGSQRRLMSDAASVQIRKKRRLDAV